MLPAHHRLNQVLCDASWMAARAPGKLQSTELAQKQVIWEFSQPTWGLNVCLWC